MHIHIGLIALVTVTVSGPACTSTAVKYPVDEHLLTGKAARSWHLIKEDFLRSAFIPCLAKRKIVISCGGCTSVFLRGILHIDSRGRYAGFEKTFGRFCGSSLPPDIAHCFISHFRILKFPPELRGMSLRIDLGRGLKC